MDFCLHIVMPPAENLRDAVAKIMEPFYIPKPGQDYIPFWDTYEIGGDCSDAESHPAGAYTDKAGNKFSPGAVVTVGEASLDSTPKRVVFANARNAPAFMVVESLWNGVIWQDTTWDHTLGDALAYLENFNPRGWFPGVEYDWLVVAVEYSDSLAVG